MTESPERAPDRQDEIRAGSVSEEGVRQALEVLLEPGQTTELMLFGVQHGTFTTNYSGFYDNADELLRDLVKFSHPFAGAYIRLNPVDTVLLSRGQLQRSAKGSSATDADVLRRSWLFIDVDPVRRGANGQVVKGIPASDDEAQAATDVAQAIPDKLTSLGFPAPVIGFSGNGWHILYRVDLPRDSTLPAELLGALKHVFETRDAEIDTTVASASRLIRLYGTANCKGAATPDRPFRMAEVSSVPEEVTLLSEDTVRGSIRHLADLASASASTAASDAPYATATAPSKSAVETRADPQTMAALPAKVRDVLGKAGLEVAHSLQKVGYVVHELKECACGRKEQGCSVTVSGSGALGLHCHHATCEYSSATATAGKQWTRFRRKVTGVATTRTDTDYAELLVAEHGEDLRYVPDGGWFYWNGERWLPDKGEVFVNACAKATARGLLEDARTASTEEAAALARSASVCLSARGRRAMVELARREAELVVSASEFDSDPWVLGVANGTVDLRTGQLRPPERSDMILRYCPVTCDPDAVAPRWHRFLERVLPDPEARAFIQRLFGYSLTGVVRDHVVVFLHGPGRNGKSTLLEVIGHVLGDYHVVANPKLLLARRSEGHPVERMTLRGKRLAVCAETGDGERLAEDVLKSLSGGDTQNARALFRDEVNFRPTHKLVVATNHLPAVRGTDEAIWSRIIVVPFRVVIPESERDTTLLEQLLEESSGILNWAVQGCLAWQSDGLTPPAAVRSPTADHRANCDHFARFLSGCCELRPGLRVTAADLRARYLRWCDDNGDEPLTTGQVGRRLADLGCARQKSNSVARWLGIQLTTET